MEKKENGGGDEKSIPVWGGIGNKDSVECKANHACEKNHGRDPQRWGEIPAKDVKTNQVTG